MAEPLTISRFGGCAWDCKMSEPETTVAEFRANVEEAIIREINDPRNSGMPADFRDGLRVARCILNYQAQLIGAYPDPELVE